MEYQTLISRNDELQMWLQIIVCYRDRDDEKCWKTYKIYGNKTLEY